MRANIELLVLIISVERAERVYLRFRLQDVINNLRKTYTALEESTRAEIQKITNQILKSHTAIIDLEEKSNHLTVVNDKKYMQIWDMNIETANELVDKVR